jgi:hypothetical protein
LNQTESTLGQIKSDDALAHLRLKFESAHVLGLNPGQNVDQESTFAAQLPGRRGHTPLLLTSPSSRLLTHQGCGRQQALACETPATRIDLLKGVSI